MTAVTDSRRSVSPIRATPAAVPAAVVAAWRPGQGWLNIMRFAAGTALITRMASLAADSAIGLSVLLWNWRLRSAARTAAEPYRRIWIS